MEKKLDRPCNCKSPAETLGGWCATCKRKLRAPSEIRLATDVKDWRGGRARIASLREKTHAE